MIGMIALSGIVVRNSVVLIDFIHLAKAEGHSLEESHYSGRGRTDAPNLVDCGDYFAGQLGNHTRSCILWARMGHNLRHPDFDHIHADRDSSGLLAVVSQ